MKLESLSYYIRRELYQRKTYCSNFSKIPLGGWGEWLPLCIREKDLANSQNHSKNTVKHTNIPVCQLVDWTWVIFRIHDTMNYIWQKLYEYKYDVE